MRRGETQGGVAVEALRWGVIGAGGIADRRSIPGMLESELCALSVVMDVAHAGALGQKYRVAHVDRMDAVLSRDDVDAVYIATPVHLHGRQVIAAAEAGKHVLCEKPIAQTLEEARAAVAACRRAGVLLASGYMMRFHGAHVRIAQLLKEGAIGTPVFARAQLSCWYPPIEGAWRQDPALGGGGSLIDMGVHLFDLVEMLLGPVARVAARTGTLVHGYRVEDAATVLLEFETGAHGVVDAFFCVPDAAVGNRLEIYGSRGAVRAEGTIGQGSDGEAEIYTEAQAGGYDARQERAFAGYRPLEYARVNPYARQFDAFAERVRSGERLGEGAERRLLRPLRITCAAYTSARSGRFVDV